MKHGKVLDVFGNTRWYVNNRLHRTDGPAIICPTGSQAWYLHNKYHREDGPAIELANGDCEWYLYGQLYTFSEWLDLVNCTPEQRTLLLLKWS